MPIKFSASDVEAFRSDIDTTQIDADIKKLFCEHWETAKSVLEALRDLLKNPIVKAIISTVIAAGDAVHSAICK